MPMFDVNIGGCSLPVNIQSMKRLAKKEGSKKGTKKDDETSILSALIGTHSTIGGNGSEL